MRKISNKQGIEGKFFSFTKSIYENPQVVLKDWNLSLKTRKKAEFHFHLFSSALYSNYLLVRHENKAKYIQIGKEEVKPPLCADNMKTKNSKESTQKSSQNSLSEFSKVSIQVSTVFQYTSNKQSKTEKFLNTIYNISKKEIF